MQHIAIIDDSDSQSYKNSANFSALNNVEKCEDSIRVKTPLNLLSAAAVDKLDCNHELLASYTLN